MDLAVLRFIEVILQIGVLIIGYRRSYLSKAPMFFSFVGAQVLQAIYLSRASVTSDSYAHEFLVSLILVILAQIFCTVETIDFTTQHYPGAEVFLATLGKYLFAIATLGAFGFVEFVMPRIDSLNSEVIAGMHMWRVANVTTVFALLSLELGLMVYRRVLKKPVNPSLTVHRRLLTFYFAIPVILAFLIKPLELKIWPTATEILMMLQSCAYLGWIVLATGGRSRMIWFGSSPRTWRAAA